MCEPNQLINGYGSVFGKMYTVDLCADEDTGKTDYSDKGQQPMRGTVFY